TAMDPALARSAAPVGLLRPGRAERLTGLVPGHRRGVFFWCTPIEPVSHGFPALPHRGSRRPGAPGAESIMPVRDQVAIGRVPEEVSVLIPAGVRGEGR